MINRDELLKKCIGIIREHELDAMRGICHPHPREHELATALKAVLEERSGSGRGESRYLCNGTRFKLSFTVGGACYALANFSDELGGKWVALVPAEDDRHLTTTPSERTEAAPSSVVGDAGLRILKARRDAIVEAHSYTEDDTGAAIITGGYEDIVCELDELIEQTEKVLATQEAK